MLMHQSISDYRIGTGASSCRGRAVSRRSFSYEERTFGRVILPWRTRRPDHLGFKSHVILEIDDSQTLIGVFEDNIVNNGYQTVRIRQNYLLVAGVDAGPPNPLKPRPVLSGEPLLGPFQLPRLTSPPASLQLHINCAPSYALLLSGKAFLVMHVQCLIVFN